VLESNRHLRFAHNSLVKALITIRWNTVTYIKSPVVQEEALVGSLKIDLRGYGLLFEHEHGLDQAGQAGTTFCMANISLDRTDRKSTRARSALA
jgi:hypothetical protein